MAERHVTRDDVRQVVLTGRYQGIHPFHGTRQYEGEVNGSKLRVALDPVVNTVVTVMWIW
jgi:hypothetical protein